MFKILTSTFLQVTRLETSSPKLTRDGDLLRVFALQSAENDLDVRLHPLDVEPRAVVVVDVDVDLLRRHVEVGRRGRVQLIDVKHSRSELTSLPKRHKGNKSV